MHGNRKGPENEGAKTGRGLGFCSGGNTPGFESNEAPMGMRRGKGFGRRAGRGFGKGMQGSGRNGLARGRGQGYGNKIFESDNAEIKTRLDAIENLLKEMNK